MAEFGAQYNDTGEAVPELFTTHMATMRRLAREEAYASDRDVAVVTAGRIVIIFRPDGTAKRPDDSIVARPVDDCKRDQDGVVCFCAACRAERRAKR